MNALCMIDLCLEQLMPRISEQQRSDILRLHLVEKWPVGTIATQLGVHHSSVERIISQAGMPKVERAKGPSIIDPYLPFIHQTLEQYPTLSAARLYQMVSERGYPGGPSHFRQWVAQIRPRKPPEAYLRLKTFPGEQAQVDWGHFGHLQVGRARRELMAFVMVLSYSRMIYLQFYHNAQMASFLNGHVNAFAALGVPRVVLYDNLKSAVLQRHGRGIHFNDQLLDLSAHYRFEPRPVAVRRGNEKGRVERAIRYIRDNFFAARDFDDLPSLNDQAREWCADKAAHRPCPGNPDLTVADAFEQERAALQPLPETRFDCDDALDVQAGKTPYVRYDLNDYSIPHEFVRQTLQVRATAQQVRIYNATACLATHPRCYDKGRHIADPQHIDALRRFKGNSARHSGQHRLYQQAPDSEVFLQHNVELGHRLSQSVRLLTRWLDQYGNTALVKALQEALAQSCYHTDGVLQILERHREQHQIPVPLSIQLPDKALDHSPLSPASLKAYDRLVAVDTGAGDPDEPCHTLPAGDAPDD
jgi:transposase